MARRPISAFSLSFLDCMCCGFGAVILVFMIISNRITTQAQIVTQVQRIEAVRLGARVEAQREKLADKQEQLQEAEVSLAMIERELRAEFERKYPDDEGKAQDERRNAPPPTPHVRQVLNRGNRQYLTGLRMGGKRALILVDTSASMLDRTIVNVLGMLRTCLVLTGIKPNTRRLYRRADPAGTM